MLVSELLGLVGTVLAICLAAVFCVGLSIFELILTYRWPLVVIVSAWMIARAIGGHV